MLRNWMTPVMLSSLLAGCTVGPDYDASETEVPADWPQHTLLDAGEQQ